MKADEVRKLLREKFDLVQKKANHFAILGIDEDTVGDDLKTAYFALVKLLHPDRLARAGIDDMTTEGQAVFRAISVAYETLSQPNSRASYVAKGKAEAEGEAAGGQGSVGQSQDVRIFVHRGDLALKRRAYADAEDFFRKALEAGGDDDKLYLKLGEAVFHNPEHPEKKRLDEARQLWEKARDIADDQADALYHIALYWKAKGDLDRMEDMLRDVLTLRPKFVEAARELRLIKMRRRDARGKSIFGRLKSLTRKLTSKKKKKE